MVPGCLLLGLLAVGSAYGSTVTNSGTFSSDSQVDLFSLVLTQTSNVNLETDSYGGGTLGGVTVSAGGFIPVLSLFGPTGTFLAVDGGDGVCQAGQSADPSTGLCEDADIMTQLAAGTYTIALTEFYNYPNGNLSAGFSEAGMGNFTGATCGASGGFYDDISCTQRTDAFSFAETVTAVAAPVPEPASFWLASLPLFALGLMRWRQTLVRA